MEKHGVKTKLVRAVEHYLAPGAYPDSTEHGTARDDRATPPAFDEVRGKLRLKHYGLRT